MSSTVGLIFTPENARHIFFRRQGMVAIFCDPYEGTDLPLMDEADRWVAERFEIGAEFYTVVSGVPFPLRTKMRAVKDEHGIPRVKPEMVGMLEHPWISVMSGLCAMLTGQPGSLPKGYRAHAIYVSPSPSMVASC